MSIHHISIFQIYLMLTPRQLINATSATDLYLNVYLSESWLMMKII